MASGSSRKESPGGAISENIRVFCRVRPEIAPQDSEEEGTYLTGGGEADNGSRISEINEDANECIYSSSSSKAEQKFKMDGFFGPNATQEKIYDRAVRPVVESALDGYSATVFAYGPTGSGKTYTMMGDDGNITNTAGKGIIPRVFDQLLSASHASGGKVVIKVSYLQIYCEIVSDLLDPSGGQLSIRERNGNVFVENLSESTISSYSDVQRIIERGDENRNTASTNMNAQSSRSHAAMLVRIYTPDPEDSSSSPQNSIRESTLVLVDLAGSERSTAIAGRGYLRAEESKSINLSLSALGNCISALSSSTSSSSSTRRKHVPYRDSKLTRLLQGSLGGGCRTAVVVNLMPGEDSSGEVLNALRFAQRCSTIAVVAKVRHVVDYEALYMDLQRKLDEQEQREREQQMDLDKQYESMEAQDSTIDALRDEIKALKTQNEQLKAYRAAQSDSAGEDQMKRCLEEVAAQSAQEVADLKRRYEKRINAYKAAASESAQEIAQLQLDLKSEREKHLATVKDLNVVNERYSEAEKSFEYRIQELLSEVEEAKQSNTTKEAMQSLLETKESKINDLEEKLYLLEERQGSGGDMVSRAQVEEMEKMFSDTVEQLIQRVQVLEESKGPPGKGGGQRPAKGKATSAALHADMNDSDDDEMAYLENRLNSNLKKSNQPNAHIGLPPAPRNVRFEPGKVRANNSTASSNQVGGRFGSSLKPNARRF